MGSEMTQRTTNLIECFVKSGNSEPLLTWTRVLVDDKQVSSFLSYTDEDYVIAKDDEGPWNSFTIEQNAGQSTARLEFVSEWTGVITLECLKADGSPIKSQELKAEPGLMTTDILLSNEGLYIRLSSQEQSILIPIPRF
jgi:hypothetical protein